jgi:Niemann-Pick C1 protein
MTMISSEVAPFLVLAVGVDNMFIIYNSFKRQNIKLSIPQRLGLALREVGPSITAATICEFFAFLGKKNELY